MNKLKFLGRGSAFNVKEGNTSAYLKQDDMLLLIDCGESVFQRILEKKLLDDVKEVNVLITHFHSDHCGSLSSLIMYCFYCKGIKANVYYPEEYQLRTFLDCTGCKLGELYNILDLRIFKDKYEIGITSLKTLHVKEIPSYSYVLTKNNIPTLYTGDTTGNRNMKTVLDANGIVYTDCCLADYDGNVHTSLRKLCELVPREFRERVYCMHIDNIELIDKANAEGFYVVEVR
jgi:glyoxylase-like metal-dependent hydrolase (beta-lactamase superfamily II)